MRPVTIVIPNFNGTHLLRRNLPSVIDAAAAYPGGARIIVVDDGSSDPSVEVLGREFPGVSVVVHEDNRGFSEAVLSGVRAAGTELLFILNSDVELHHGCLEKLEPYFDDETTFSVAPVMLDEDGSVNSHSWNLRAFKRGYLNLVDWKIERARLLRQQHRLPTMYASGGCMLVSRSKFLDLGGFHPIFKPFYGEDFDLGIRAWYRGWASYFEPNATLVHQSHGSIKNSVRRAKVKEIRRRNRYLLEWIHIPGIRLLTTTLPYSLLQVIGEVLLCDRINLKGCWSALRMLPQAVSARRQAWAVQEIDLETIVAMILASYTSEEQART